MYEFVHFIALVWFANKLAAIDIFDRFQANFCFPQSENQLKSKNATIGDQCSSQNIITLAKCWAHIQ